jgi:hypothetical protein
MTKLLAKRKPKLTRLTALTVAELLDQLGGIPPERLVRQGRLAAPRLCPHS